MEISAVICLSIVLEGYNGQFDVGRRKLLSMVRVLRRMEL